MELTELNGDPTIITSRESVPLMAEDIIGEEVVTSTYTHTLGRRLFSKNPPIIMPS